MGQLDVRCLAVYDLPVVVHGRAEIIEHRTVRAKEAEMDIITHGFTTGIRGAVRYGRYMPG